MGFKKKYFLRGSNKIGFIRRKAAEFFPQALHRLYRDISSQQSCKSSGTSLRPGKEIELQITVSHAKKPFKILQAFTRP